MEREYLHWQIRYLKSLAQGMPSRTGQWVFIGERDLYFETREGAEEYAKVQGETESPAIFQVPPGPPPPPDLSHLLADD